MTYACARCGEAFTEGESQHMVHEPDCTVAPDAVYWPCDCQGFFHAECCRLCHPERYPLPEGER